MEKELKLTEEQKKALEEVNKLKDNKLKINSYCYDCYNCFYCYNCYNCSYCSCCYNCSDCSNCSYCSNQKYKKFMINNVQFTKEQYTAFLKGDLK